MRFVKHASVVAFTLKAVVEVCKALQMVKSGCQPVVNRALQDHLDPCLSEDGKLKLAKVVTQKEHLDDFLKITKEQGAEWQEQLRAKQKEASEKAAESKEKLEGFLVPLGESHWEEWLKKVPAGEVLKAELKKLTKAEKALSALEASAPTDTEDLKMPTKAQIHCWHGDFVREARYWFNRRRWAKGAPSVGRDLESQPR